MHGISHDEDFAPSSRGGLCGIGVCLGTEERRMCCEVEKR